MTEFGAKIGASITNGFTFIDHHSWDAYNESSDLELQIQLFEKRFGYLPAKLYADKIYLNKSNRQLLKTYEIEVMGTPLGRPSAESKTKEARAKQAKIAGERNEIEATFGTAKRVYKANNIRAKLPETANSWTGMCYLVKNVMEFLRRLLHAHFLMTVISKIYGKIRITILPDQNNVIRCHLAY
ncbi:MAG: transposase [Bacteroidales bacterium]